MKQTSPNGLSIIYLPPEALTPYENNTRKHTPDDIDQIKASIQDLGFNDPIAVWGEKNLIVEGQGRQIAAIEMGLDKVPCIRLDHMTETQRRDYAIRHNRTAELSGWDFAKLEEEIAALEIEGVDLSGLMDGLGVGDSPSLFDAMQDDFGVAGNIKALGTVTLTFDSAEDAEEVKSYIRKNEQAGILEAVLNYVRDKDA